MTETILSGWLARNRSGREMSPREAAILPDRGGVVAPQAPTREERFGCAGFGRIGKNSGAAPGKAG